MIVGGHLADNPSKLEKGIRDRRPISPATAAPDLKVGKRGDRDIAFFLDR